MPILLAAPMALQVNVLPPFDRRGLKLHLLPEHAAFWEIYAVITPGEQHEIRIDRVDTWFTIVSLCRSGRGYSSRRGCMGLKRRAVANRPE